MLASKPHKTTATGSDFTVQVNIEHQCPCMNSCYLIKTYMVKSVKMPQKVFAKIKYLSFKYMYYAHSITRFLLVVINLSVSLYTCCSITSGNTNNAFSISTSGSEGKVACNTATLISNGETSYTLVLTYVFLYIHLKINVTYFLFGVYCIHICVRMAFSNSHTIHKIHIDVVNVINIILNIV